MARRGEHFGHQEAVAVVFVFHRDVVDIAGVHAFAALGQFDPIRPDPARFVAAHARGRADCDRALGGGRRFPCVVVGNIQAMGRGLFKDTHALAKLAPVFACCREGRFALDHHQNDLAIPRDFGHAFTLPQAIQREAHIPPARRLRRNLVDLAVVAKGFLQKISHHSYPCPHGHGDIPAPAA